MNILKDKRVLKGLFWGLFLIKLVLIPFIDEAQISIFEDYTLAENLVEKGEYFYNHDGVRNRSFQFPVYPYLLFVLSKLFGLSAYLAVFVQVLSIGVGAWLISSFIYSFFERINQPIDSAFKYLIATVVLIYPSINNYAYFTAHTFAFNFFMLALFLFVSEAFLRRKLPWWILGLTFGLLMLQRSSLAVLVFYPLIASVIKHDFSWRKYLGVFLLAAILPLSWSYRNYQIDGVFGMTSTTGKILWKGSIKNTSGSNYIEGDKNFYAFFPDSLKENFASLSVKEQNDVFMSLYRENRSDWYSFTKSYFTKLKGFFTFRKGIGTEYSNKVFIVIYQVFYMALLTLVILALLRYREHVIPIVVPFVLLGLFQAWFYVEMRHRIIYEPVLISLVMVLSSQFSFKKSS